MTSDFINLYQKLFYLTTEIKTNWIRYTLSKKQTNQQLNGIVIHNDMTKK